MNAMVLDACAPVETAPLAWREMEDPLAGPGEIRVRVHTCGICRTDLHVIEGELPPMGHPVIPGHQIVGTIDQVGSGTRGSNREIALGSRGCITPAVNACIVGTVGKTFANPPFSPATMFRGDTRSLPWHPRILRTPSRRSSTTPRQPPALRRDHRVPEPQEKPVPSRTDPCSLRFWLIRPHRDPDRPPLEMRGLRVYPQPQSPGAGRSARGYLGRIPASKRCRPGRTAPSCLRPPESSSPRH